MYVKVKISHYIFVRYQDKYQTIILLQENESYLAVVKVKFQICFLHILHDFVLACVQLASHLGLAFVGTKEFKI